MFPEPLASVLYALRVSTDELQRWNERGWVSFGPDRRSELEEWDVDEIRFTRDVVRSGLQDSAIEFLLAELPRPMNFPADAVAYSFGLGWVVAVPEPDDDEVVDRHLSAWLERLAVDEDRARLAEIRAEIDVLLGAFDGPQDQEPMGSAAD